MRGVLLAVLATLLAISARACSSSSRLRSVTSLPSAVRTVNSPEAMAASMAARSVVVNAMRQECRKACAKSQNCCTIR